MVLFYSDAQHEAGRTIGTAVRRAIMRHVIRAGGSIRMRRSDTTRIAALVATIHAIVCNLGNMANEATATITIHTTAITASASPVSNTASVSATSSDPDPSNNTDSAAVPVAPTWRALRQYRLHRVPPSSHAHPNFLALAPIRSVRLASQRCSWPGQPPPYKMSA